LSEASPSSGRGRWRFRSREAAINQRFDDDEIFTALVACRDDLGHVPRVDEYVAWANRPDVRARPGRRPRSDGPFARFGGFRGALLRAGLLRDASVNQLPDGSEVVRRNAYSSQELLDAIKLVASTLGHLPRREEYRRERDRLRAKRDGISLPTVHPIEYLFGSWDAALAAAVRDPAAGGRTDRGNREPAGDEQLDWMRRAWVEIGDPFTITAYEAWRRTKIEAEGIAIPSYMTITRRFGSWQNAKRLAFPDGGV
jgi:hypothetical protein